MTKALLINAEEDTMTIVNIPSEDSLGFIQESVGGYIDCVRGDEIVGYVNDEGLLIGLPINAYASMLFGRLLVGNVLITGAYNKDGEYDGDDHDAPQALLEMAQAYMAINFDTPLV